MLIQTTQNIKRPVETVWYAFTNHQNWRRWFGDDLVKSLPDWTLGAQLVWKDGRKGTVANWASQRAVSIRFQDGLVAAWTFKGDEKQTQVKFHCDFSKAKTPPPDVTTAKATWTERLDAFKNFVEQR